MAKVKNCAGVTGQCHRDAVRRVSWRDVGSRRRRRRAWLCDPCVQAVVVGVAYHDVGLSRRARARVDAAAGDVGTPPPPPVGSAPEPDADSDADWELMQDERRWPAWI